MHRKLRMHFAENACNNAMQKLCEVDKEIMEELNQKKEEEKKSAIEALIEPPKREKRDWRNQVEDKKEEREEK